MSSTRDIIDITITRESTPVYQQGLNVILIVGPNATFVNRINFYTDLASIAAVLTGGVAAPEYLAASAIFAQNPYTATVAIGKKLVGDTTYADALNAILLENPNFYGVIGATRVVAEQEVIATWVQANKKFGVFASAGTDVGAGVIDIKDQTEVTDTTSIAHHIRSNSLDRCSAFYHSYAATQYLDAGLLSYVLALTPGSYTASFKTVKGITADILTTTQENNLRAKYCNFYTIIAGVNMTLTSKVGTGEPIDVVIFQDWLESDMTTECFSLISNSLKVPYTAEGISAFVARMNKSLKKGQDNGGISADSFDETTKERTGGYEITVPSISSQSSNDRIARIIRGLSFKAWLAGASEKVYITGTLTVVG